MASARIEKVARNIQTRECDSRNDGKKSGLLTLQCFCFKTERVVWMKYYEWGGKNLKPLAEF